MKKTIFLAFALLFQVVTPAANPLCRVPLPKPIPRQQQNPVQTTSGGLLQGMLSDWRVVAAGVTTLSALSGLAYYYFKRRVAQDPEPDPNQDEQDDGGQSEDEDDSGDDVSVASQADAEPSQENPVGGRRESAPVRGLAADPDEAKHEDAPFGDETGTPSGGNQANSASRVLSRGSRALSVSAPSSRRNSDASTVSWIDSEGGDDQAGQAENAPSGRRESESSVAGANASVLADDGNIVQGLGINGGIDNRFLFTEEEFQKLEDAQRDSLGQLLAEVNRQGGQPSELSNAINAAPEVLSDQEDEKQEEQGHVVLNVPARSESPSIAGSASTDYASVSSSYHGDNEDGSVASNISSGIFEQNHHSFGSVVDDMLARLEDPFDVSSDQEDEKQQEDPDHVVLSIPRRESVGSAMADESHGQANASDDSAGNDAKDDDEGHRQQVIERINQLLKQYFTYVFKWLDYNQLHEFTRVTEANIIQERRETAGVVELKKFRKDAKIVWYRNLLEDADCVLEYFGSTAQSSDPASCAHREYYQNHGSSELAAHLGLNLSAVSELSMNAIFRNHGWDKRRILEVSSTGCDINGCGLIDVAITLKRNCKDRQIQERQRAFVSPLQVLLAVRFAYGLDVWKKTQLSLDSIAGVDENIFREQRDHFKVELDRLEAVLSPRAEDIVRVDEPEDEQTTDPIESQGFLEYIDQIVDESGSPQPKRVLTHAYLRELQDKSATRSRVVINDRRDEIVRLANKGADWLSKRIVQPYPRHPLGSTNDAQLKQLERARAFEQEERTALEESLDTVAGLLWFIFANSLTRGEIFAGEGDFMLMEGGDLSSDIARYLQHFYNVANKLFLGKTGGNPVVELSSDLQRDLAGSVQESDIRLEFCLHMRYGITDNSPEGAYEAVLPPHNYGKLRILILKNKRVYLRPEAVDSSWENVARNVAQAAVETGSDVVRRGAALVAHAHATALRGAHGRSASRLTTQDRLRPVPVTRGLRHTGRVAGLIDEFLQYRDRNRGSWGSWLPSILSGQPAVSYGQQIRRGGLAELQRRLGTREQDDSIREQLKQLFPYDTTDRIRQARFSSEVITTDDHLRTSVTNRTQARL